MADLILNSSKAIETSNFIWLGLSLVGLVLAIIALRSNRLSLHAHQMTVAFVWVFLGSGINHGWFALSRDLAPPGEMWHPVMFEWRAWVVVMTTVMFTYGMSRFFSIVLPFDGIAESLIVIVVVVFAIFLGVV